MTLRRIALSGFCCVLSLLPVPTASQGTPESTVAKNARAFVASQAAKDYAAVVATFDSNLRQNLSAPQLEQAWKATLTQFGEFKRIVWIRTELFQGNDLAHVKCEFDRVVAYFHISYNSAQRVTVFYLTPLVSSASHQATSTKIVEQLIAGQFDGIVENFNDDLRKGLSPAVIGQVWGQTTVGRGKSGRITEPMPMPGQVEMLEVTCEFEHGAIAVDVAFDAQGKVSGLWVRPVQ